MRVRDGRRAVGFARASTAAFVLVAVAALTGPAVAAAPGASLLGHVTVQTGRTIATGGCHVLRASAPRFHKSSARATWLAVGSANRCPNGYSGPDAISEASEQVTVQVTVPVHPLAGRAVGSTVSVTWNVTAIANISTVLGSRCPTVLVNASSGFGSQYCEIAAYAEVQVAVYLYDATNGSEYFPTVPSASETVFNDTTNSTQCFDFTCQAVNSTSSSRSTTLSGVFSQHFVITGTLDHRHAYVVVATLTALIETLVTGYTGAARASAALNLQNAGNGATLGPATLT